MFLKLFILFHPDIRCIMSAMFVCTTTLQLLSMLDIHPVTRVVTFMAERLCTGQDIITTHGTGITIMHGHGRGDSTFIMIHGQAGRSVPAGGSLMAGFHTIQMLRIQGGGDRLNITRPIELLQDRFIEMDFILFSEKQNLAHLL